MKYSSLFAAGLFCLLSTSVQADDKPLTSAEVEAIVKKVIAEHPEIIMKSVEEYQNRQQAEALAKAGEKLASLQKEIRHDSLSPSAGNPRGDITVIEFFDYHCGYCKRFYPALTQLVDEDKNVRIVFKEFPILSEDSELAAKAALAVNSIDPSKYFAFHSALMKSTGRFDMGMLTETAKEEGISESAFKKAMENPAINKELENTKKLAQSLNITGTPAIVIGDELVPGAIDLSALKTKIAAEREAKAKKS